MSNHQLPPQFQALIDEVVEQHVAMENRITHALQILHGCMAANKGNESLLREKLGRLAQEDFSAKPPPLTQANNPVTGQPYPPGHAPDMPHFVRPRQH